MKSLALSAAIFSIFSAALAPPAGATGLIVARFGGEWGHPMSDDLWAIYYNPAGLSLLGGTRLTLSGSLAWRNYTYDRDPEGIDDILAASETGAGTPEGEGVASNSGRSTLMNAITLPFFAVGSDFGIKGFGAALGVYVPFGGQSIWDRAASSDAFPGAVDGPQRWWTIEGTIRSIYATAALAYRLEPHRLSFGVGLSGVLSELDNVQARNADGTDHLVVGDRLQEGRARVDVHTWDLALSLGLLWEPVDNLFFGLSYQSQPGFGQQRLTGTADLVLGGGPRPEDTTVAAEVTQEMPEIVRVGLRYGAPEVWEARIFADWANWSVLDEQCILNAEVPGRSCKGDSPPGKIIIIPRNWEDAWGVRMSGSYWLDPDIELVAGLGFDGNAIPDTTLEPALFDSEKVSLTLGGRFELLDGRLALSAQYTQVFYAERDIAPRGRTPVDPANPEGATVSDLSAVGLREAVRVPDSAGHYSHALGLFELGASLSF